MQVGMQVLRRPFVASPIMRTALRQKMRHHLQRKQTGEVQSCQKIAVYNPGVYEERRSPNLPR